MPWTRNGSRYDRFPRLAEALNRYRSPQSFLGPECIGGS